MGQYNVAVTRLTPRLRSERKNRGGVGLVVGSGGSGGYGEHDHADEYHPYGGSAALDFAAKSIVAHGAVLLNPLEGEGGGGVSDYADLAGLPSIGGVTIIGDRVPEDYGLASQAWVVTQSYLRAADLTSASVARAATAGYADSTYYASVGEQAVATNQLEAYVTDNFQGGGHYVKAIKDPEGWGTRLWTCYRNGAAASTAIQVGFADAAHTADTADTVDGYHANELHKCYGALPAGAHAIAYIHNGGWNEPLGGSSQSFINLYTGGSASSLMFNFQYGAGELYWRNAIDADRWAGDFKRFWHSANANHPGADWATRNLEVYGTAVFRGQVLLSI